jgi:hypothetical protein
MASFVLTGSLVLITYVGPNTIAERVGILPKTFRLCFHGGLCIWWILQSTDMICSAYAVSSRAAVCLDHQPPWDVRFRSYLVGRVFSLITLGY